MKHFRLMLGAGLALTSVWAIAQDAPESLLPPGFDRPSAKSQPRPPAPTQSGAERPAASGQGPVVQPLPGASTSGGSSAGATQSGTNAAGPSIKLPPLDVLAKMSSEELTDLLGLRPKTDIPAAARRSMTQIGLLAESEGGLPSGSLAGQNASLVRAALNGNKGQLVSRWGHILLRRALASRLDAPAAMNPADFAGLRAALLLRMGEGDAARSLVQDVDSGNYTPLLTQAALDAYIFTADFTGICPAVTIQGGGTRKDAQWQAVRAICAAFQGDGNGGLAQLDRQLGAGAMPKVDLLLAQKYAGAAGKARRAVKIEWDGVNDLTPWRYGLTIGVGLEPPQNLMSSAPRQIHYMSALAPMLGLESRAAGADQAAAAGILSSAAMVDLYSQIYNSEDIEGDWATRASQLRDAYVGQDPGARLAAMKSLWSGVKEQDERYSREVLTAYAAARLPADEGLSADAPAIIGSMLTAGLDRNAMLWAPVAENGSEAWGLLVLAAPASSAMVDRASLDSFHSNDGSENARKSAFLLAGLAGLDRVSRESAGEFAQKLNVDLTRQNRWTRAISQSANVGNRALVALLAGLGMQGESWAKMTPLHLYHIVSALHRTGFDAEARMIAAEAVARG